MKDSATVLVVVVHRRAGLGEVVLIREGRVAHRGAVVGGRGRGLGAADACYQCALDYAQSRIQFDRPIAAFQLQQEKFAGMVSELAKGQLLALQLGRLKDAGKATPAQVSLAKMNNTHMALDIARKARTILGANGILDEYPVMRHMANLESVYTYEGTHDIHALIVGEAVTGHAAYL